MIIGFGLILMNLLYMTDPSRISGGLAHDRWDYFTSQFIVVSHYIGNFILPIDLSADPDFVVTEVFSRKKFFGMMLIGALHYLSLVPHQEAITGDWLWDHLVFHLSDSDLHHQPTLPSGERPPRVSSL